MEPQTKRSNHLSAPPIAPPEKSQEFFTCSYPDCSYKSNWEENVGRHEWGHNPAGSDCNIPCQICSQKFLYLVSFLHHMTSKHSEKLFCPLCLFLGEDLDEFKAHVLDHILKPLKSKHIKISKPAVKGEFNCAACSKNFAYQRTLHRHQKHYCTSNCTPAQRPKSTSKTGRKTGRPKTSTNIDLRCANCSLTFLKKANLVRHQKNICRIALLCCDQCSYRTSFAEDLRKHINIHLAGEQLKCKHFGCDYSTLWTQHLRKHHQSCKIRVPAPETLDGISRAIDMLMEEMKIVEGESEYSCSFCSFKSKLMSRLKEHLKVHVGRKPLRCSRKGCNYETKTPEALRNHMRRVHPRKPRKAPLQTEENLGLSMEYEIKTEGAVEIRNEIQDPPDIPKAEEPELTLDNNFRNLNNPVTVQNEDALKVHETLHRCDKCSFTTLRAKNLRAHSWKHTSMKPFKCPHLACTFATRWAQSLREHQRSCPKQVQIPAQISDQPAVDKIKTKETTEDLVKDVKATDGETLFCCTICSFRSKWKTSLRVHLRVHDDTRPFRCVRKGCKYRAKWSSELRKHYKIIHQLELPLKAPIQTQENLGSDRECKDKIEGFVSSSTIAFACMFCEFTGDSKLSALKHSCEHKTVVVSLDRIVPNAETILGLIMINVAQCL